MSFCWMLPCVCKKYNFQSVSKYISDSGGKYEMPKSCSKLGLCDERVFFSLRFHSPKSLIFFDHFDSRKGWWGGGLNATVPREGYKSLDKAPSYKAAGKVEANEQNLQDKEYICCIAVRMNLGLVWDQKWPRIPAEKYN